MTGAIGHADNQVFAAARQRFADCGVDVEVALARLQSLKLSLHCWQGDDVGGFEPSGELLGGGLAVTGSFPGKARNADELRADIDLAMSFLPGRHRVNLHASYLESPIAVDRDAIEPAHFAGWVAWARDRGYGLDFNPTYFAHRLAAGGFTLAHRDAGVRRFWIDHGIRCRRIAAGFGRELGSPSVCNVWIPDGMKDSPADRRAPRERLRESLDAVFAETLDSSLLRDAVEAKLFGIGSESYVVGSHEFYFGYAVSRNKLLCLDTGHLHPTEVVSDKLSAVLCWLDEILLHVSRGIRWDSDHVVVQMDELQAIAYELARGDYFDRVHIGLDFFDASIDRVAAWVIGARATLKALLIALLEPTHMLQNAERAGDYTARLTWMEAAKTLPWSAVWEEHCRRHEVSDDVHWLARLRSVSNARLTGRSG